MAEERDLQEAFRALRESDARIRPELAAVLGRPAQTSRRQSALRIAPLSFAFMGLFVFVFVFVPLLVRSRAPRPAAQDLWVWRSPTRSLLPPASSSGSVPRLGETWGAPVSKIQEDPK